MISTLRFAKRVPTFLNKFHRLASTQVHSSSAQFVSHPSYHQLDTFTISEYGLHGVLYKHKKSGAEVISVVAPDDNKVFGITFRTPPKDRLRLYCSPDFTSPFFYVFIFVSLQYRCATCSGA